MKYLRLMSLRLRNFMGIRDFGLKLDGLDASIYGDNAVGKTTLVSAVQWLLFGRDAEGRTDFAIKTLDASGQVIHGLEHEVEATLATVDSEIGLKKVYKENWTKKRGSADKEFSGHTTDHYVNNVPVTATQYKARVAELLDERVFRLLTDPYAFASLPWQERRKLLMEICGDVSDADVIAATKDLAPLTDILGQRSMDDHRKVVLADRRKINEAIAAIPTRIDEVTRAIPDITGIDLDAIDAQLAELRLARTEKESERALIASGGGVAEKTVALRETEAEIQRLETDLQTRLDAARAQVRSDLSDTRVRLDALRRDCTSAAATIATLDGEIERLWTRRGRLRDEWQQVRDTAYTGDRQCPTCGQDIPADRYAAAVEAHNLAQAEHLSEIQVAGRRIAQEIEVKETERDRLAEQVAVSEDSRQVAEACVAELEQALADVTVDPDPGLSVARARKTEIETQIRDLRAGTTNAADAVKAEIAKVDAAIADLEARKGRIEQAEGAAKRIEELKAEGKRFAAEYERLEREIYLMESFVRAKVSLLEESINARFEAVRFKLFNTLVNGGVEECCVVTYGGVPWDGGLNSAAQINAGLEIIDVLAKHYDFAAPIMIDGAESVTAIRPTLGQQIRLVVSEPDKKLRTVVHQSTDGQQSLFAKGAA